MPEKADLVFTVREVRRDQTRLSLNLLCPTEPDAGKRAGMTCSSCLFCGQD